MEKVKVFYTCDDSEGLEERIMEKVKVFYTCDDPEGLEERINEWLEKAGDIEITRALQGASGRLDHRVTVTVFYKPKAHAHCREKQ